MVIHIVNKDELDKYSVDFLANVMKAWETGEAVWNQFEFYKTNFGVMVHLIGMYMYREMFTPDIISAISKMI